MWHFMWNTLLEKSMGIETIQAVILLLLFWCISQIHVDLLKMPQISLIWPTICFTWNATFHAVLCSCTWILSWDAQGISLHFVWFQSNSTHCNVHGSRAATENCVKCGISYETDCCGNYCELRHSKQANLKSGYFALKSCTFYRAREPHVNPDSFTFHKVSNKQWLKFHLKIPACEWQHSLQWNLSQIHSYHGGKDQTSKEIATCEKFDSLSSCCEQAAAGMLRAFPAHFVPLQSNSTHCNVHNSRAGPKNTENWHFISNRCWTNNCELWHFKDFTLKSV